RTTNKVNVEEGRKRVRRGMRRPLAEWDVLLKDQHEGYISRTEFERNQRVIADNAAGKGGAVARGAARQGELLLAGLLRCGHCGRKMYVAYGGKAGRYHLSLRRRAYEPRRPALHLVWRLARRSGRRRGSATGLEAVRRRRGGQGARRAGGRDVGR